MFGTKGAVATQVTHCHACGGSKADNNLLWVLKDQKKVGGWCAACEWAAGCLNFGDKDLMAQDAKRREEVVDKAKKFHTF